MTVADPKENPLFNGIRGLFTLMVIFAHCFIILFIALKEGAGTFINEQFPSSLLFLLSMDELVDIFFVLSAYLLTNQLIYEVNKKNKIDYLTFCKRRWYRIYPLFFVSFCFYSLIYKNHLTVESVIKNLFMIGNITGHNIIPVGWSLDVEMQFYLTIPLVVFIIHKMKNHVFTVALLLASIAIRYWASQEMPAEALQIPTIDVLTGEHKKAFMHGMYYPTHTRFGAFVMGIIWAYAENWNFVKKVSKPTATAIFSITLPILIFILHYPVFFKDNIGLQNSVLLTVVHRHIFTGCFVILAILVNMRLLPNFPGKTIYKFFSLGIFRIFSQLSYGLYLFHFPFVAVAYIIIFQTTKPENIVNPHFGHVIGAWIVTMLLTTPLSYVLHKYVEVPFMKKGRKRVLKELNVKATS